MNDELLESIRPREHARVIDLVEAAGIDISDWANFKGTNPSANPRYCYEWVFVDPSKMIVLNLWFDNMSLDESSRVVHSLNIRQLALDLERNGKRSVSARRARAVDQALQDAVRLKLPVRVVINDGRQEVTEDIPDKASSVKRRMLDEETWNVETYDWNTGDCLLVRSPTSPRYVDQFSLPTTVEPPEKTSRSGDVFVRSPEIRQAALTRAAGHCEFCGEPGFETAAGGIYLESHHVLPLGEGGPDSIENVIALCPGHHRQAHHGVERDSLRIKFQRILDDSCGE